MNTDTSPRRLPHAEVLAEGLRACAAMTITHQWPDEHVWQRLHSARRARETAHDLEAALVREAREAGESWSSIGDALGITPQAAHKRFRHDVEMPPQEGRSEGASRGASD